MNLRTDIPTMLGAAVLSVGCSHRAPAASSAAPRAGSASSMATGPNDTQAHFVYQGVALAPRRDDPLNPYGLAKHFFANEPIACEERK